jgi:acetyltransferase-like isoleucine patch superfamily enzyme
MAMRRFIHKIKLFIDKFGRLYIRSSSKRYESYLRKKGIKLGKNIYWGNIRSISIDTSRPCLLEIGDNVRLDTGLTILTHDYACYVFKLVYKDYIGASAKVTIGNNVYFGNNCTVLKGVTIGDNCIIGTGSIVTKDIPSNSVAVGVPARVVSSLNDYYKKRKKESIKEAKAYAREIKKYYGRNPEPEDFVEEFALFWAPEMKINSKFRYRIENQQLAGIYSEFVKNHPPVYNSFEEFIADCGL